MQKDDLKGASSPSKSKKQQIEDFDIIGSLGKGSYGDVLLARTKQNNIVYAIKVIDKDFLQRNRKEHEVFVEKEVLQILSHPGIIKLKSSFQNQKKLYFVLEYAEGGNFNQYIRMNNYQPENKISFQTIQFYIAELLLILEYVHSNGIVHRDIKPENLMLDKRRHLKLIDFATAMVFDETKLMVSPLKRLNDLKTRFKKNSSEMNDDEEFDQKKEEQDAEDFKLRQSSFVGTNEYLSPELIDQSVCGPSSDLWALGCVCFKMFCGQSPFYDSSEYNLFQMIVKTDIIIPNYVPEPAKEFIHQVLQKKPLIRIGVMPDGNINYEIIKKLKFFEGLQWDNIWNQDAPVQDFIQSQPTPRGIQKYLSEQNLSTLQTPKLPQMETQSQRQLDNFQSSPELPNIMNGTVQKEPSCNFYNRYNCLYKDFWQSYSPRIMTLTTIHQTSNLTYINPKSKTKRTINIQKIVCEQVDGETFFIQEEGNKKILFKSKTNPSAQTWVNKINNALNSLKKSSSERVIKC